MLTYADVCFLCSAWVRRVLDPLIEQMAAAEEERDTPPPAANVRLILLELASTAAQGSHAPGASFVAPLSPSLSTNQTSLNLYAPH
jgi:hypothetical protein